MATVAYLLPPLTGLLVYLRSSSERARFHGLQSVAFGALWPLALVGASLITPGATQVVFALGALTWVGLLAATALGRDPSLPGGGRLRRLAVDREEPAA